MIGPAAPSLFMKIVAPIFSVPQLLIAAPFPIFSLNVEFVMAAIPSQWKTAPPLLPRLSVNVLLLILRSAGLLPPAIIAPPQSSLPNDSMVRLLENVLWRIVSGAPLIRIAPPDPTAELSLKIELLMISVPALL